MATYGEMQYRIADELGGRTDLLSPSAGQSSSPIQLAINDAIAHWHDDRMWFNEYRTAGAFNTVAGQEFYDASDWADIETILHIDKLSVLISGNRYFMVPRTEQYMEDISMNPSWRGQPVDYSYYNFQLRFYPIPDNTYPVNVLGTKYIAPPSADGDSNVWTTTAESLIRATAKLYLYRDTLRDDASAQSMAAAMNFEYGNLKGATTKKQPVTRFKPTNF